MERRPTSLADLRDTARQRLQAWKYKVTPFYKDNEIERVYQNEKDQVLKTINQVSDLPRDPDALAKYFRSLSPRALELILRTIIDIMGVSQEKFLRMVHVLRKIELTKQLTSRAQWAGSLTSTWTLSQISNKIIADVNFAETIAELLINSRNKLGQFLPEFISSRMQFPLDMTIANRVAEDRAYKAIRNQIGEHLHRKIVSALRTESIEYDHGKYNVAFERRNSRCESLVRQYPELRNIKDVDLYIPSRLSPHFAIEVQFGETTSQGMRTKAKVIERDFERLRDIFPNLHTYSVVDGVGWEVLGDNDVVHFFNASEVYTISEIPEMVKRITRALRHS